MIPTAIERNYPKRLLKAGWWHMIFFSSMQDLQLEGANVRGTLLLPSRHKENAT